MKEDLVNYPKHYNHYPIEVNDMMVSIWGVEKTIDYCVMNAFKYRMRLFQKGDDEKAKEDFEKEQWYLNKAKELKNENIKS